MNFEIIRLLVAIGGTAFAAYQDGKTSFIDERLLYGMAVVGLVLDLLTFDFSFIGWSVGLTAAILGIGYFAYRSGQFGSGDVWLFAALALLLPFYPQDLGGVLQSAYFQFSTSFAGAHLFASSLSDFGFPLILSVFIAAAALALVGSSIQYGSRLSFKRLKPDWPSLGLSIVVGTVAFGVFGLAGRASIFQLLALGVLVVPAVFLSAFKQQIMEDLIVRKVPLKDFEDEDIIVIDAMPARIVKKYSLGKVATKGMMAKLREVQKKEGITRFPVCKGLPRFGPYVLIGLLLVLLLGDVLAFIAALS